MTATAALLKKFDTGAVRSLDAEGTRYDLISPIALEAVAATYAEGAAKYGAGNWLKGIPASDLVNHALRHINQYVSGDRSEPHLPHAIWNLMTLFHFSETRPDLMDLADYGKPPIEATPEPEPEPAGLRWMPPGTRTPAAGSYFTRNKETGCICVEHGLLGDNHWAWHEWAGPIDLDALTWVQGSLKSGTGLFLVRGANDNLLDAQASNKKHAVFVKSLYYAGPFEIADAERINPPTIPIAQVDPHDAHKRLRKAR